MSKIEWTNETWNPIIGCSKISPGCKNCYAEKMAYRLAHIEKTNYYISVLNPLKRPMGWSGECAFIYKALLKPLKRKKPTMYFVCSMGDLFHESVPFEWIMKIYDIIAQCPQHTFQILTKRPERMKQFFEWLGNEIKNAGLDSDPTGSEHPFDYFETLPNLWLGTTIENQDQIKRAYDLLKCPAKTHFVSIEPMLGYVDLELFPENGYTSNIIPAIYNIDWVICGGESGHNARPIHPDWVRSLKDQCQAANVPFFFKQWHKKSDGSQLDGKEYKQFPKK